MKKSLLAVVAALAMAGCSQNDLVDEIDNGGQISKAEIKFSSVVNKVSRATPLTSSDQLTSFQVYGYTTGTQDFGTGTATSYLSDKITYSDGWNGTKTYYWPLTDKLSFFAYSSSQEDLSFTEASGTGYPSFSYTVAGTDTQEDLLVAQNLNNSKPAGNSAITLNFSHALTQVNFAVQLPNDDYYYKINNITLEGIKDEGTYTYAASNAQWTGDDTTLASYVYAGVYSIVQGKGNPVEYGTGNNALLLLPQTLGESAKISVEYIVTKDANGTTGKVYEGTQSVSLANKTWEVGKNIKYTLALQPDGVITYSANIGNWETAAPSPVNPN